MTRARRAREWQVLYWSAGIFRVEMKICYDSYHEAIVAHQKINFDQVEDMLDLLNHPNLKKSCPHHVLFFEHTEMAP